jgi:hypothetical protein
VRALLAKIDQLPDQLLLFGSAGLAGFVMVAHGGALLVRHLAPPDQAATAVSIARYSLPVAGMMLATAALAMLKPDWRTSVLAVHAVILVVSSFALFVWAGTLLLRGIPEGNFAWTPGFLTAWVWYSFYLLRRYTLPSRWSGTVYLPVVAAGIALPVDLGVLVRFLGKIAAL